MDMNTLFKQLGSAVIGEKSPEGLSTMYSRPIPAQEYSSGKRHGSMMNDDYMVKLKNMYEATRTVNPTMAKSILSEAINYMNPMNKQEEAYDRKMKQLDLASQYQNLQKGNLEIANYGMNTPIAEEEQQINQYVSGLVDGIKSGAVPGFEGAYNFVDVDETLTPSAKLRIKNKLQQFGSNSLFNNV